jgi:hypothetical protein
VGCVIVSHGLGTCAVLPSMGLTLRGQALLLFYDEGI